MKISQRKWPAVCHARTNPEKSLKMSPVFSYTSTEEFFQNNNKKAFLIEKSQVLDPFSSFSGVWAELARSMQYVLRAQRKLANQPKPNL